MRAIPDDNFAYSILLRNEIGKSGSGFYLKSGNELFLVTTWHVLFDLETDELPSGRLNIISYPNDLGDLGRIEWTLNLTTLVSQGNINAHPERDVVVGRIATETDSGNKIEVVQGVAIRSSTAAPLVFVKMD